jgi:hypothetical protein
VKREAAQTGKKTARSNMVKKWRSEFDPHCHLRREASVRQYNGAGMFCQQFYLRAEQVLLIYNAQIY